MLRLPISPNSRPHVSAMPPPQLQLPCLPPSLAVQINPCSLQETVAPKEEKVQFSGPFAKLVQPPRQASRGLMGSYQICNTQ